MGNNDQLATKFFEDGEQVSGSVTIQKSADEVYALWSGLEGLPRFVHGIERVTAGAGGVVAIQARSVSPGTEPVAWQAEILKEEPGRMIAWRSVGAPMVPNAGSITLRELPFSRGTEVRVVIDYIPPKGSTRERLDDALGRDPKSFLQLALFRFRQLLEAGEVTTTQGQPSGRDDGRDEDGSIDEKKFAKLETIQ